MVVLMAVTVDSSSGVGGDGNASSVLMVKISLYRMGRANVRGMMYISSLTRILLWPIWVSSKL